MKEEKAMKDEKKVITTEEVKDEVKAEENGVELTDEQLSKVSGGRTFPGFPGYQD